MNIQYLLKFLQPLIKKIDSAISKGIIESTNDSKSIQLCKVNTQEKTIEDVERPQEYGFSSLLPDNTGCVVLQVGGNKNQHVIAKTDGGLHRPSHSEKGEIILYDSNGNIIKLNSSGIQLNGKSKSFVTHAELSSALSAFIIQLNSHTHASCSAIGTPSPPVIPHTLDISASKTTSILTGG